jgi:hypothetical protein
LLGWFLHESRHESWELWERFQLQRLQTRVTKYNSSIGGIFLDFYGDTTDVDVSRSYDQFPFYPMQITEIQFTKAVATWAHDNVMGNT